MGKTFEHLILCCIHTHQSKFRFFLSWFSQTYQLGLKSQIESAKNKSHIGYLCAFREAHEQIFFDSEIRSMLSQRMIASTSFLRKFWVHVDSSDKHNKCTWCMACDSTFNNYRSGQLNKRRVGQTRPL